MEHNKQIDNLMNIHFSSYVQWNTPVAIGRLLPATAMSVSSMTFSSASIDKAVSWKNSWEPRC